MISYHARVGAAKAVATNNAREERIRLAKCAMLNNRNIYDDIADSMYYRPSSHDLAWFGSMLVDIVTLYEQRIQRAFSWAAIDREIIARALAEIVDEWED